MNSNNPYPTPSFWQRISSIWYRHFRVYITSFFSNALPPFLEPLIYLAGLGIGVGGTMTQTGTMSYTLFLASGLIITSAMFAASMECTYGTFVRLEYDKVYDGMLGAPMLPEDLMAGEILFVGTKGMFFSLAVLLVIWACGIIRYPLSFGTIFVGFLTGILFGTFSMLITAFIKNINHFNFFFTGFLTPMFFFSGVVFPVEKLPQALRFFAEIIPLTHLVRLARAFCVPGQLTGSLFWDVLYCILFTALSWPFAVKMLRRRMIA